MINALPSPKSPASTGAPTPSRQAAGGGDERPSGSNFASLLGQASHAGRETAAPGDAPSAAAKLAAPDKRAQADAEPGHKAGTPASARRQAAAGNGERKALGRTDAGVHARAQSAVAAAQEARPDGQTPLDALTETAGARDARKAIAVDATPAESPQATPTAIAPQLAVVLAPRPAATVPGEAGTTASSTAASGAARRSASGAPAASGEGMPAAVMQAVQAAQAAQAASPAHADTGQPGAPTAASARFGDALAQAVEAGARAAESPVEFQPTPSPLPAAPQAAGTVAAPAAAEATLAAPPGSPAFAAQLGAQLTTFARNGIEHAQLHLNPAEMGPLSLQIRLEGDSAHVHMAAEHPLTRQALEQAMPTLASSLREAGLTLSGGGVFEQPRQGQGQDTAGADAGTSRQRGGQGERPGSAEAGAAGDATVSTGAARRRGVVDLVA